MESRYLGNKFKFLKFLREIVDDHCAEVETVADIFSGTGAVASAFTDKTIITNDLLYSNYLCNLAWFGSEKVSLHLLQNLIAEYNRAQDLPSNYMTDNFADTYFSKRDCTKIEFVREKVEEKYKFGVINERERVVLIASLIYAMDKIVASTRTPMNLSEELKQT